MGWILALKNLKKHLILGSGLLQVVLSPTCISRILWFVFSPPGPQEFLQITRKWIRKPCGLHAIIQVPCNWACKHLHNFIWEELSSRQEIYQPSVWWWWWGTCLQFDDHCSNKFSLFLHHLVLVLLRSSGNFQYWVWVPDLRFPVFGLQTWAQIFSVELQTWSSDNFQCWVE